MLRLAATFVQLLALTRVCLAYTDALSELHARTISPSVASSTTYDYIIVGGGQAGLVIANRLTEDASKTVLVVEHGYLDTNPAQEDPSSATAYKQHLLYNLTSTPQTGLNGRSGLTVFAAAVVGGGSTINGMMLDRGAPEDYDNWSKLGNPGWSFKKLLPYFKKATHLALPDPAILKEFNITWDLSAYGSKDTPIEVSYPSYQYPAVKVQYQGMIEAGVQPQKEGALNAYALFWFPGALTKKEVKRSYAVSGYYRPVADRKNLHLLTGYRVNEILFNRFKRATGITFQARDTPAGENVQTAKAKREIVLTSGFLHTPQILQRSGIGPAALLREANIPVLVDLPGVGANLQDHAVGSTNFQFNTDIIPNPGSLTSNETFKAWADELWATNRTGPRSITVGNVGSWLPLPLLAQDDYKSIVATIKSQNVSELLPSTYDKTLIAGYKIQRNLIASSYSRNTFGAIELPFSGRGSSSLSLEHPLSRGTIRLNTTDIYAEPLVDYNTFVNPIDPLVIAKSVKFVRKWQSTPAMQQLSPVEVAPGADLQTDEQLVASLRDSAGPTTAHGCCTAAMSPRLHGGVVDEKLRVYGVSGLSIGDVSTIPLIPGSHTCSTVYAIAEHAAELIKKRTAGW
ncbi:alcohol oxidase [Exidia glandulosa HHB12029]|uniref:Alcohol oxidase n=1 Tax=Exidia glandulosa HHB12029 TaxID=1314781 RepID=A0A165DMR1_EXIGL|nr:alcohol oxidase [Exidia glandulosa HHB12029]